MTTTTATAARSTVLALVGQVPTASDAFRWFLEGRPNFTDPRELYEVTDALHDLANDAPADVAARLREVANDLFTAYLPA